MKKSMLNSKAAKALLKNGRRSPMPRNIEPMLATLVTEPVEGSGWAYEMKWDGYRAVAHLDKGKVHLVSRNQKSFNQKFYPLHDELSEWDISVVLDGEIVVLNEQGLPDFEGIQTWRSESDGQLFFYLFDILWIEGISVMHLPLAERRELLKNILPASTTNIRLSETIMEDGKKAFSMAQRLHLEGAMAKRTDSVYTIGKRTRDWLKIKTEKRQELIIGGYTLNEGTTKLFSALLLGIMDRGGFHFVTPVGTGFSKPVQEMILKKLKPLIVKKCPFSEVPEYNKPSRFRPDPPRATVTWVKPEVIAEISYREQTKGGAIRQPSFKGLREDKNAKDVVREIPTNSSSILKEHELVKHKVIKAPPKKERKTLLNPKEETQTRIVGGHELRFTNLSKKFWPKEGLSKRDMINYYYQVAPYMIPYLRNKPQTLNRHPHGIAGESFYQKDVKGKVPDYIETYPYFSYADKRHKEFLVCTSEASLLYVASLGCIEINPWHSKTTTPENPDWCIIDLDPDRNSFNQVIEAALVTKEILDAIEVTSFCKTSGSTGLHLYIPLGAKYSYHDSKEFARSLVTIVHSLIPKYTSIERKTADRDGKMYLDFLQNRPQATVAAPYSLRPRPGAPVSAPLHWDEVKKGLKMKDFNMKNMPARIKSEGDLFRGVLGKAINMKRAVSKMKTLL